MKRLIIETYYRWASSSALIHPNYVWIVLFLLLLTYADSLAGHRPFPQIEQKRQQSQLETLSFN